MDNGIFESELNTTSNIYAVFEDNGMTGWAYLCDNENDSIIADCWIYNVLGYNDPSGEQRKDVPPLMPEKFLVDDPIVFQEVKDVGFKWSDDGCSVYIIINGVKIAFIDLHASRSYNVNIKTPCPWGEPLKM
ncbi:hypothetical protein [Ruminococcus sp. NK3A76]|uniref:hypothetical protein n=1 Tax=Ruminococcus sp. NK3A76 TaxID=877411 RepID=UPI00048FEF34|nr:hypothetical protein [Ruminococcus sp. NK3A76]